jgi:plasmid stability protein
MFEKPSCDKRDAIITFRVDISVSGGEAGLMRRTTVRIDETLLNEAKAFAARHGRSLNSVMEDALRQLLNRSEQVKERPRVELPVHKGEVGLMPGVELTPEFIKELLLQEDIEHYLETQRDAAC